MEARWRKVLADLWGNKTRTLLTALTIAVGVFAMGLNRSIAVIILEDMAADYQAGNAHQAVIYTQPFDDAMVRSVRRLPGVSGAEGWSQVSSRAVLPDNKKVNIQISGIPELSEMRIDRLRLVGGASPRLADREVWIEASSLGLLPVNIGDMVNVELAGGRIRSLYVAGFVHDVSFPPTNFTGLVLAYTTRPTIEWLGGTDLYDQILITVSERQTDKAHVEEVAGMVEDHFKEAGYSVWGSNIYNPGRHFSYEIFTGVIAILNVLGVAIVLLSIFLVINTVNVLLNQHIKQIGIMKAIGGRLDQLVVMYVVLITSFGVLALLAAAPLSALAAYGVCSSLSGFINIHLSGFRMVQSSFTLQLITALGVPLAAGLVPVLGATRITVREAISSYGISAGKKFTQRERSVALQGFLARLVSRPLLISLHNTFRRKGRLIMMLSILSLGGAIFIAVFNLWGEFDVTMKEIQGYVLANINVYFDQPYRFTRIENMLRTTPGIKNVEGWISARGDLQYPDADTKTNILFFGPPADSTQIKPIITAGRWLQPGDQNALVIGNHLTKLFPDLQVGDQLAVKIGDQQTVWNIVGFYRLVGNVNPPIVYANYAYLAKVLGQSGMVYSLRVITSQNTTTGEQQVSKQIDELFRKKGIKVTQMQTGADWRAQQSSTLNVLIYFLLTMALLIVIVGGLGLMTTMSMNVLERTREIGILRAIGASNGAVRRLVMLEGMLIGAISWALAVVLSFPLTLVLNAGVGAALFQMPLDFSFSWNGVFYWLVGILFLAGLASLLPAGRALRLTVRDVLAYE